MPLDTLTDWSGSDDWSDLKTIKPPPLPPGQTPGWGDNFDQTWNQASSSGAAAPQADLYQQTGAAGTGASTPAPPQPTAPAAPDYSQHVAAVTNASNPQQQAVSHDTLARTLATDLQNDGHEVSWEGAQLIVDGRPYEVAGAPSSFAAPPQTPPTPPAPVAPTPTPTPTPAPAPVTPPGTPPATPPTLPVDVPLPPGTSVQTPTATGPAGSVPPGFQGTSTRPSRQQTADNWLAFTTRLSGVQGFDAAAGRSGASAAAAAARGNLQPIVDQFNAEFGTHATVVGGDKIDFGDGYGPVDVIRDAGGGASGFWYDMPSDGGSPGGGGSGGAGNYTLPGWDDTPWSESPLTPEIPWSSGDPLTPTGAPAAAPNYDALWAPSATAYTPGAIDTNPALPGYEDTLAAAGSYTPGTLGPAELPWSYDSLMSDLQSGNPVTADTDALIQRILQHPESMDPQTVAMLKARDDEEQGQAALSEDQAAKRFGFNNGLADSNWLASERAATARSADAAQIANRRTIDLTAASTNAEDRLKAASLGASYQGQRANQQNAAVSTAGGLALGKAGQETSRFTATEQAKQAGAASRQQAVSLAVDTAFKSAAEGRDRFALNESLKQQATQLGISQDKLTQDYVVNTLADLTKRYGIDVGANIDLAKLKEQSREFQQDLLVKIQQMKILAAQWQAEMEQRDRQFGSNLALNYDQLNSSNENSWWQSVSGGG